MAKKFKVNKEKCIGCGTCIAVCPGSTELKEDGKAEVIDSDKLEGCGGTTVCPYEAFEEEEK
jgi:ferredoxin